MPIPTPFSGGIRMRARRLFVVPLVAAALVALAACSSSSTSTPPASIASSASGAIEAVKATVCGELADASAVVADAQEGNTGDLQEKATSLAADLTGAVPLLNTAGLSSLATQAQDLATDLTNLASTAATEIPAKAGELATKITSAESAIGCTASSASPSS
jgi:hypothetical protein